MKLLTSKCKKDFEDWFLLHNGYLDLPDMFYNEFTKMPVTMQWGVIQDFASGQGYHITMYQMDYQNWFGYKITSIRFIGKEIIKNGVWRRKECMQQAIKQFNKLYNISN